MARTSEGAFNPADVVMVRYRSSSSLLLHTRTFPEGGYRTISLHTHRRHRAGTCAPSRTATGRASNYLFDRLSHQTPHHPLSPPPPHHLSPLSPPSPPHHLTTLTTSHHLSPPFSPPSPPLHLLTTSHHLSPLFCSRAGARGKIGGGAGGGRRVVLRLVPHPMGLVSR